MYHYKIDGIYRSLPERDIYPWQGLAIYDDWLPNEIYNVTFAHFPSGPGEVMVFIFPLNLGKSEALYCF